jgi:hypothetical protein
MCKSLLGSLLFFGSLFFVSACSNHNSGNRDVVEISAPIGTSSTNPTVSDDSSKSDNDDSSKSDNDDSSKSDNDDSSKSDNDVKSESDSDDSSGSDNDRKPESCVDGQPSVATPPAQQVEARKLVNDLSSILGLLK